MVIKALIGLCDWRSRLQFPGFSSQQILRVGLSRVIHSFTHICHSSTSNIIWHQSSRKVNRHTMRCTGTVPMVLQLWLVSGWGIGKSVPPRGLGRTIPLHMIANIPVV